MKLRYKLTIALLLSVVLAASCLPALASAGSASNIPVPRTFPALTVTKTVVQKGPNTWHITITIRNVPAGYSLLAVDYLTNLNPVLRSITPTPTSASSDQIIWSIPASFVTRNVVLQFDANKIYPFSPAQDRGFVYLFQSNNQQLPVDVVSSNTQTF